MRYLEISMYAWPLHDLNNCEHLRKIPWKTTKNSGSWILPFGMVQFRRPKVVIFHAREANYSSFPVLHKVANVGTFAQFLMRINLKCLPMKSILLQMYIIMMLLIKIEVTGNNIHQIFKVKAINKMWTLCVMGKIDLQPGCSANLRTLGALGFLMLKNALP